MARPTTPSTNRGLALVALGLLVAGSAGAPARTAWAAPPAKANSAKPNVVRVLLTAAQKEFDAGNFDRAGELFLEVWRTDADARPVLYNAARAFQLAGKIDKAEELYSELLALPALDSALAAKAEIQVAVLRTNRAERKADQAAQAERDGQHADAAALWAEAVRLQPTKIAWLARQARALQRSGQAELAASVFDQYLAQAPANAPGRAEAQAWRKQLPSPKAAVKTPVAPAPTVVKPPVVPTPPVVKAPAAPIPSDVKATEPPQVQPPAPVVLTPKRLVPTPVKVTYSTPAAAVSQSTPAGSAGAWTVFGLGAAAALGGGVVLALANSDDNALQQKYGPRGIDGTIAGIGRDQAHAEAARIEQQYLIGWGVAGAGAVATVVGLVLALRTPSPTVAVVPNVAGAQVAWRF